jgi:hypothetical protein
MYDAQNSTIIEGEEIMEYRVVLRISWSAACKSRNIARKNGAPAKRSISSRIAARAAMEQHQMKT